MWQARLIKKYLGRLNSTKRRMADIFSIMHSNTGIFCQQISDRFFVTELSYSEIKRRALCVSQCLDGRDRRIGIKMRNSYEFVVMFWGIILSGNIPVLINSEFSSVQVDCIVADLNIDKIYDLEGSKQLIKTIENKVEPLGFDLNSASDQFILTTMGSTGRSKYCFYNGEAIANFINKTPHVVKKIPQIVATREIKHLMLLPLYHCFGLFAVYFWFGFFGFPFLFIDNILTDLMQNIRNFKVTHIFAVPLFFKTIQKEIYKKAKESGKLDTLLAGVEKSYRIQKKLPISPKTLNKKFGEITSQTLGSNITFMISGGASITDDTLRLFNCMGYPLHAGYGMTEVGITSLALDPSIQSRCSASIGSTMPNVEYRINDSGVLEILSDTAAFKVIDGSNEIDMKDRYYSTFDRCVKDGKVYRFEARCDEIIAAENGENYNLNALQTADYGVDFAESYCFIPHNGSVALLVSVADCVENAAALLDRLRNNDVLKNQRVNRILITEQALPKGLKLINHREVLSLVSSGEIKVTDISEYKTEQQNPASDEFSVITEIVAKVLELSPSSISADSDLFLEHGCTSFDYYIIVQDIEKRLNLKLQLSDREQVLKLSDIPRTVRQIAKFLAERE